jgi:hypothetical protein
MVTYSNHVSRCTTCIASSRSATVIPSMSISLPCALAATFSPLLLACQHFDQSLQELFNEPINCNIVTLHTPPMPPAKCHFRGRAINFKYLPCECWHHPLEGLVAHRDVIVFGAVVLIRWQNRVVRPLFQRLLGLRSWATIHRKRISFLVDCAPICQPCLERRFDLPVLDEVFDHVR